MADFSFDQLINTAKDAGYETEVLPANRYPAAEATHVKVTATQGGKQRIGIRFKVLGGPHDGGGVWMNQTVPNGTEKNAAGAAAAFLRVLKQLGVTPTGTLEQALQVVIGQVYDIEVVRNRPDSQGGFWTDVNVKGGGPTPAADAPVAAPAQRTAADEAAELKAKLAAIEAQVAAKQAAPEEDDEFSERPV